MKTTFSKVRVGKSFLKFYEGGRSIVWKKTSRTGAVIEALDYYRSEPDRKCIGNANSFSGFEQVVLTN